LPQVNKYVLMTITNVTLKLLVLNNNDEKYFCPKEEVEKITKLSLKLFVIK